MDILIGEGIISNFVRICTSDSKQEWTSIVIELKHKNQYLWLYFVAE